jgi:hypothetical protein
MCGKCTPVGSSLGCLEGIRWSFVRCFQKTAIRPIRPRRASLLFLHNLILSLLELAQLLTRQLLVLCIRGKRRWTDRADHGGLLVVSRHRVPKRFWFMGDIQDVPVRPTGDCVRDILCRDNGPLRSVSP